MVARWMLAILFLPSVLLAEGGRIVFTAMADGTLGVTFPRTVLADDEVRRQLTSGLTTTFVAVATGADRARTAARVEVRYDLWDEQFLVKKIEFDGAAGDATFHTFEELERWWRSTPLRLLRSADSGGSHRIDVELTVLPFSAAESRDAREWLSKGAGVAPVARGAAKPTATSAAVPSTTVVDALIGTSLQAKPLLRFRWRTDLVLPGGR